MIRDRLRRLVGLAGLGVRRVVGRSTGPGGRRTIAGVVGTAVAVALLVSVTGVGVALAADATVLGSDVDYWIVPESGESSVLVASDTPELGSVHDATARIDDGADYATPVLTRPIRMEAGNAQEYVLVVGVIGAPDASNVAGASPQALTPGDPHYANGSYDGPWTGDLVATEGAARVLDVDENDAVTPTGSNRSFTVVNVDRSSGSPTVDLPIVLVHLSELQVLVGADEHDSANQFLVATNDRGVRSELAGLYDGATVETRSSLLAQETVDEGLPLALAIAGLLAALIVGVLFVSVTIGLEVLDQGPELSTMQAMGIGRRSRLLVIGVQTLATAAVGGLLGVALGWLVVFGIDRGIASAVGIPGAAMFHPLLIPYGIGIALVVGLLALPPVLWLVERASSGSRVI
ncbi:ABC transporter permease [Salinarchaeum laminariae]|uniref:ABC transporter permease n=1 Tax=Salinarchaeum laminariae TaxID=869888 RepID=UPI0020BD6148|nr:ABC transporter permease [Salinarchaeum laminariae]